MDDYLKHAATLIVGVTLGVFGHLMTGRRDRAARLREFRKRVDVWRARLQDTPDAKVSDFYDSTRDEIRDACASIRSDIRVRRRVAFDAACGDYCGDKKRTADASFQRFMADFIGDRPVPPTPDPSHTTKQRLVALIDGINACV